MLKAVGSNKEDNDVLTVSFMTCALVKLPFLCTCRLCSPSQVVNLEVLAFIYVCLVIADPQVTLSCIGGAGGPGYPFSLSHHL
jgi:hypothetical protein